MNKQIINTKEELRNFIKDYKFNFNLFALDTETSSLNYYDQKLLGISLCDGNSACYIREKQDVISFLKEAINDLGSGCIMHNAVFDLKMLRKVGFNFVGMEIYDTMIMDHLVNENRTHGLKQLAKDLLGHNDVATWEQSMTHGTDSTKFAEYAMNDAIYTWELFQVLNPQIKELGLNTLYKEIEMPFINVLVEMEENGILVDKDLISTTNEELQNELSDLQIEMLKILNKPYQMQFDLYGGMKVVSEINFNSSHDIGDILFNQLGLISVGQTESGKDKTGKEAIEALKGQHPFVDALQRYKVSQKLLNGFFTPLPEFIDPDGRVRPHYNDTGAATGRLSCNAPNIQQLPKDKKDVKANVRKCFIVPKGKKMITCDYSGQELRILAQVSQDEKLIEAFNSGRDFHQETANQFGVTRTQAKAINFGIAYGKGAFGFSKDFKISEEEAQKILDNYFNSFPRVKEAMNECKKDLDKYNCVQNIFGRHRRFEKVGGNGQYWHVKKSYRQAFNFKIQGAAADMIRLASISTLRLSKENPEWELKQIATVHDENVYECNEKYVEIASKEILKCFANTVKFAVPMISEIGIGNDYSEAK